MTSSNPPPAGAGVLALPPMQGAAPSPEDPGFPARLSCATLLAEALQDQDFTSLWRNAADAGFRGFAVAVLQLGGIQSLDPVQRRAFYRQLATQRRGRLLAQVLKLQAPAAPRIVKLIGLADWKKFSRRDWRLLLAAALEEGVNPALAHLARIKATLVHQYAWIPQELRLPAILIVASTLRLSQQRWRQLGEFLRSAEPGQRADLLRSAGTVDSIGAFWDFYVRCEGRYGRPFAIPQPFSDSALLQALETPAQMEAEGLRMNNCLANRVGVVRSGSRVYFRLRTDALVNAELVCEGSAWVPGEILGPHNAETPPALRETVRNELARLAALTRDGDASAEVAGQEAFIAHLRAAVRKTFDGASVAAIRERLRSIRGRSLSWTDGAYAIFELRGNRYLQCLSSPDGKEILCEISSHKYLTSMDPYLTEKCVDILQGAGFDWPRGKGNFLRWFSASSEAQLQAVAEVALALLAGVFGYRPGENLECREHIPAG